jgi:ATP-dependent Clp endopeptidase proteolytic subunit ClpP
MNSQRKFFIPMNDLPNEEELMRGFFFESETDSGADKVSERRSQYDPVPEPPAQPLQPTRPGDPSQVPVGAPAYTPPGGRINEMDFVWGFFFFDMPSVFVDRNRIFFQGEIYRESVTEVKRAIINVGRDLTQRYYDLGIHDTSKMSIELWITSPGGAVSAGFSLIDFMQDFHIPIHTVGTGTVASMAVLLLLAGKERALTTNSNLLVHQLRAGINGKLDEILDYMKHLDELHKQMSDYIVKYTKLDASKVKDMLARESWIMAQQALEMGFVDRIIGGA